MALDEHHTLSDCVRVGPDPYTYLSMQQCVPCTCIQQICWSTQFHIHVDRNIQIDIYTLQGPKRAALVINQCLYNNSIGDTSAGLSNTREKDFVKVEAKSSIVIKNLTRVPLKLEKSFIKSFFLLNIRSRQFCHGCMKTTLCYKIIYPHLLKQ